MTLQLCAGLAVGVAALVEDVGWRRVSNWTSGGALVAGLSAHAITHGWKGLIVSALGAGAGFGVFLVFYLLSGMGGGDIKLMAGFGALLGIPGVFHAAVLAAIAGGILAVCVVVVARLRRLLSRGVAAPEAIPYAPAIVAGSWLALISSPGGRVV